MNCRIVAGLLGLALVGSSRTAWGTQAPEPVSGRPGVPTDPTTSGPRATLPRTPDGASPVGLTPLPNLAESLADGYPTGGYTWFTRRNRTAPAAALAPRKVVRVGSPAPTDPSTVPAKVSAGMVWDESGENPAAIPTATPLAGRPAPYADHVPDLPRPQATAPIVGGSAADGEPIIGRPAPFRTEVPRQGRPRLVHEGGDAAPKPRPRSVPRTNPRMPSPAPEPAPVLPPPSPGPAPIATPSPAPGDRAAIGSAPAVSSPEMTTTLQPLPEFPGPGPEPLPLGPEIVAAAPVAPDPPPADLAAVPLVPLPFEPAVAVAVAPDPVPSSDPAPTPAPMMAQAPVGSPVDPEVRRTTDESTRLRIDKFPEKNRPIASAAAATVGGEVITVHQVQTLVVEKYKSMTEGQTVSESDKRETINMLGTVALDHLIDQSLVLQAAQRRMTKPAMKQQFDDFIDKKWRDEKLPALLRKTGTTNEYELKLKLAEEGRSYPEMMENYHKEMLEHDFLFNEIRNKINVDQVKLRAYYNEHIHDYDQPEQLSWREIEINVAKYPDRPTARRQAAAILARLREEDFAAVAAAVSDGPTASKGGLYADMTPGSYGILPVNDVLGQIPEKTISPVIEAQESLHIIRVESRRAAGPLPFHEVQKKIAEAVFEQGMMAAREQYLANLRSKTLVRIMPMFEQAKAQADRAGRADNRVIPAAHR